jgi:beta-glucosidase
VHEGRITAQQVDTAVRNILRVKFRLGLFDDPYTDPDAFARPPTTRIAAAYEAAVASTVLLKNDDWALPLARRSARHDRRDRGARR